MSESDVFQRYAANHLAEPVPLNVPTEYPPATADIRFRPGPGGTMSPEWAAYMLNLWWAARDKNLPFGKAVAQTVAHFMVGEQP